MKTKVLNIAKTNIPLWVPLGVFIIILVGGGFGGNYYHKQFKKEINAQIKSNEELLKRSQFKEDSLINISNNQKLFSDQLRFENEQLQSKNNSLYHELKKRNKQIFVVDTDFMSNASRITESSRRFYKENDTIR